MTVERLQRHSGERALGNLAHDILPLPNRDQLPLFRQRSDDPLVLGQHRVDPGAGGATFRQDLDDAREHAERLLQTAEAARL